jgi:capsular exopolysaccharide synthesis family protein
MDKPVPAQIQPMLRRPVPQAASSQMMLTPKDIMSILRRHLWLIIILTFIGFIGGGTTWFLLRRYAPKYTASTYIRVLPPVETDPMKIGSPIVAKDIQYGRRVYIASLLKEQSMLMDLLGRDAIQATDWYKSFGSDTNRGQRMREALEDLKNNMGASASRDAEFVVVSMTCGSPDESAGIVNEMVDLFINSQRDTTVSGVRGKLVELEKRRTSLERELDLAERALKEVRDSTGITDLEEKQFQNTITLRLNKLDQDQQELLLEVTSLQSDIVILEERTRGPIPIQVENEVERDPTMMMLTQQMFAAKTALAQGQTKYGENHRIVRELKERIDDLQQRRDIRRQDIGEQTRRAQLEYAQDQLKSMQEKLDRAESQRKEAQLQKQRFDLAKVEYDKRLEIRDQLREQVNGLKDLIEQRRIQAEDPEAPKVISVGKAPKPLEMSSPKWKLYFPGGTMLGFASAIGLAFLFELLNDLLRTPRDVVRYVKIPLLGVIPNASEGHELEGINPTHIVRSAPYSIVSEAYRQLQINLRLSQRNDGEAKVLFITSCGGGEGKTSLAVNLATLLADGGERVLLVDANFWRPAMHKEFSENRDNLADKSPKSTFGLSNLLSGQAAAEKVIRPSGIDNLDIIDAGPTPSNPTELLASGNMSGLIEKSRQQYDRIIIDGAPILLVGGAKVLAGCSDGTILVFNADMTRRGAALRAVRELRELNVSVLGCVLLGVRVLKGGYFQEQFRSFQKYQQPLLAG